MSKRLYTETKIFFSNPYVISVDHESSIPEAEASFRKLKKYAIKNIHGTWGFCQFIEDEFLQIKNDFNHQAPPGPRHFFGMTQEQQIESLFDPDYITVKRSYWCFKDELDALQFRLMIGTKAQHVTVWPSKYFSIYDYSDDE